MLPSLCGVLNINALFEVGAILLRLHDDNKFLES